MGEDSAPAKEVTGLIPGAYYDLIGRVSAGAPVIAIVLWDSEPQVSKLNRLVGSVGFSILLLIGAYTVGLMLDCISALVREVARRTLKFILARRRRTNHFATWKNLLSERFQIDPLAIKNKDAQITLKKMHAESCLCQNLVVGFVALITLDRLGLLHTILLNNRTMSLMLVAVLIICAAQREIMFAVRLMNYQRLLLKTASPETLPVQPNDLGTQLKAKRH